VRVALVGYTNAGKSTLLNLLSKSDVLAENKLFATLDTTVRKVVINRIPFLLSDTVGFIRKLPHLLVESFKATLDEVREADLLLHVVDVSHSDYLMQMQVVDATLKELDSNNKPQLVIFNKVDLLKGTEESKEYPGMLTAPVVKGENSLYISAREKTNIDLLQETLYERVKAIHITRYPYSELRY
jgi:GTP-binding protein HflX